MVAKIVAKNKEVFVKEGKIGAQAILTFSDQLFIVIIK